MKYQLTIIFTLLTLITFAQVGIGTLDPKAELDLNSAITTTYLMDINFNDDYDGVTTSGSPAWNVQAYQDSICFSSNNTTANQTSDATITVEVPPFKEVILTFDIHIDLTPNGLLKIDGKTLTEADDMDWTRLSYALSPGVNKIVIALSGDGSSNFPGKVAIDNVKVFYMDDYALRIDDGNQQDGYVLTSDQYGNATWKESRLKFLIDNDEDTYLEVLDANSMKGTIKNNEILFLDERNFNVDVTRFSIGTVRDSLGNVKWGLSNSSTGNYGTVWGGYNKGSGDGATAWGNSNEVSGQNGTAWGKSNVVSGQFASAWGKASKATGDYSTAFGYPLLPTDTTETSGAGAVAWGINNKAEGFASTAFGWNNQSIGPISISWGKDNISSGAYSTAMGEGTIAETLNAVAMGKNTKASGANSVAKGFQTHASGDISMVWGNRAQAIGENSTAWGYETEASGINSTAFGDSNIASNSNSIAFGINNISSGSRASTWGNRNVASGTGSTAWGENSKAIGDGSTAFGFPLNSATDTTKTLGVGAVAWGTANTSLGDFSTSWGQSNVSADFLTSSWGLDNQANGDKSTVWGESNQANGNLSTAWGNDNFVPGEEATAWGKGSRSEGLRTTAFGHETRASAFSSTSFGRFNKLQTSANKTAWVEEDPLFVVGNGTGTLSRNDAIHLKKNGHFGVNTIPEEIFHIYGDESIDVKIETGIPLLGTSQYPIDLILDGGSSRIEFHNTTSIFKLQSYYDSPRNYFDLTIHKNGGVETIFSINDFGDVEFSESVDIDNFQGDAYALVLRNDAVAGKARAYSWNTYSDKRIKRNVLPLESGLKEILYLSPKRYDQHASNFNNNSLTIEEDFKNTIGLIAQETYEVLPDVVVKPEDPSTDLWSIDYPKLIPVIINAIKELHLENEKQNLGIDALQTENKDLKAQLEKFEALEARIDALEKLN